MIEYHEDFVMSLPFQSKTRDPPHIVETSMGINDFLVLLGVTKPLSSPFISIK